MNIAATVVSPPTAIVSRPDTAMPILAIAFDGNLVVCGGSQLRIGENVVSFDADEPVAIERLIAGEDYGVRLSADGKPFASLLGPENPINSGWIAGFHFAPCGNATARSGGLLGETINLHSFWDVGFRPSCPDPRGMVIVEDQGGRRFWIDIYLLGVEHKRNGTSRCGVTIADGNTMDRLNYQDAVDIMAEHGKRLPTFTEFHAAAFGVTERSSVDRHPKKTGLDVARTSRCGMMQATGNLWVWGTDGDPDDPRPSIFGGSWISGSDAGSRIARVGCFWPENSREVISARGASDHLSPA